ncbi:hypothetical protein T4B_14017 [Trichinella pseudospiralis]|uniref:Uncharacterized protein n=1 Tax=Trichinella pseudospiralis TaxID=6337 RepID=A0A0V1JS85_TRIPS|nr:hypothetical protein T4B_14017 [Trichinella pseudospiralis]KRZ37789.1 hypothetical protein T4C_13767 [Trichinella pseudospiralis]
MLIECYKYKKWQIGLTRKRWRIVNEKRHVQKRACESARMLCLHRFFSCHKLHAYFHVRRFQFPFSYPWRVVASICSRSSKSGQIAATSEHLLLQLKNKTIYEHKAVLYSYIGACLDGLSDSREQLFPTHGAARLRCH